MATNGAFTARLRLVGAAFPESGEIGEHGPGKFEQEPLAKAFGNKQILMNPEYFRKSHHQESSEAKRRGMNQLFKK